MFITRASSAAVVRAAVTLTLAFDIKDMHFFDIQAPGGLADLEMYSDLRFCCGRVGRGDGCPQMSYGWPLPSAAISTGVRCSSSQIPPRGLARLILLPDVRGGELG
jgi:hypothetical protein